VNLLSDARTALHEALSGVFDEPFQVEEDRLVAFSNGRVHRTPPAQAVAPCVWIEQGSGGEQAVGTVATGLVDAATFPVAIIYDGTDRAQVDGLDELVARVYDAARTVGTPRRWEPRQIDVGGPNLRGSFVDVDMSIGARTLCGSTALSKEAVSV
jgi:hypothetical protein